jgi:nuclear pore complex protein Nup107
MGRQVEEGEGDGDGAHSPPGPPHPSSVVGPREQFRRYRKKRTALNASPTYPTPSHSLRDPFSAMSPPSATRQPWMQSEGEFQSPMASIGRRGAGSVGGSRMSFGDDEQPPWAYGHEEEEEEPAEEMMETKPSISTRTSVVLRQVKPEPGLGEETRDSAEESYGRFAFMMNQALQDEMSWPEFMEQSESTCHDLSQMVREEAAEGHRPTEERLMRQTAVMLHSESGTWSLLWHLHGKGTAEMYTDDALVYPATSQQEAVQFIVGDSFAQQCLRIVQWLERLASKDLDYQKKYKGWDVGSYSQNLGVWHHTQRAIRKRAGQATLVHSMDPDATTREQARLHPEDQKLEEDLLEDLWKLLRAGRLQEAQDLCRAAGQPWRAASLGGCGALGASPPVEVFCNAGQDRVLQALELESGIGHQRRLWKWACYCASEKIGDRGDEGKHEAAVYAAQCGNLRRMLPVCFDWESACWAIARSLLDTQVDSELLRRHPAKSPKRRTRGGIVRGMTGTGDSSMEASDGPHSWPQAVLEQQPRDLVGVFQKLHSGDLVHDNVQRSCKEQQRMVQMDLMMGDYSHLLDLLKDWTIPKENTLKPHGHPQMVRFGAHLVLVLRRILADATDEVVLEKLRLAGDLILNGYVIFLFTEHQEDLVGVYASQLAPHLCVELYVNFMDLRQNDNVAVKYRIFRSAIEFLPFFQENDEYKGCVSDILEK